MSDYLKEAREALFARTIHTHSPELHWLWAKLIDCCGARDLYPETMVDVAAHLSEVQHIHSQLPDTEFQRWLFANGACTEGRVFVGKMTAENAVDSAAECGHFGWIDWLEAAAANAGDHDLQSIAVAELERCGFLPSDE